MAISLHFITEPPIVSATSTDAIAALQSPAIASVLRERLEQVERHGYSPAHDAEHEEAQIGQGALAYVCAGLAIEMGDTFEGEEAARSAAYLDGAVGIWPWESELFRPTDYATCLVKAAAMLIAELDRVIVAKALFGTASPSQAKAEDPTLAQVRGAMAALHEPTLADILEYTGRTNTKAVEAALQAIGFDKVKRRRGLLTVNVWVNAVRRDL